MIGVRADYIAVALLAMLLWIAGMPLAWIVVGLAIFFAWRRFA